jgi:ferredoxin
MDTEIYYFTGTGNSFNIAKILSKQLGAKLIPIASIINKDKINSSAKKIGIVFPVYFNEIPGIIRKFVEKLKNLENKYIFGVATYGGGGSNSTKQLKELIKKQGGRLKGCFGIQMPQNSWKKPYENKEKILKNSEKRIKILKKYVLAEKEKNSFSSPISEFISIFFKGLMKKLVMDHLTKITNSEPGEEMWKLINISDKEFKVNSKCIGCGNCAKVCPVNNIKMENKKPKWKNKCEGCLACYNFCPVKAIEGGFAQKGFYYLHPNIKESDMVNQKTIKNN